MVSCDEQSLKEGLFFFGGGAVAEGWGVGGAFSAALLPQRVAPSGQSPSQDGAGVHSDCLALKPAGPARCSGTSASWGCFPNK